jgi:hypothetical protein
MTPGEFDMYTAILTIASTLAAYASTKLYGAPAVMAGSFVLTAMAVGVAADLMRAWQRAAVK